MRLTLDRSFAAEFFGSRESIEFAPDDIASGNLFGLVGRLDALAPGFAEIAPVRAAFAVDGTVVSDWSTPLTADSDIFLLPRVGGGEGPLRLRKLEPFGIEVLRDLSQPFSPDEEAQFAGLLWRHGLILARGQSLSMERQRALCALFGPILDRLGESGYMSNEPGGAASSAYRWHSDAAYTKAPFDALSLHALDVVDDASSTLFASAVAGYRALPGEIRSMLDGCEQEMIAPHQEKLAERTCDERDPFGYKRGIRPAVFEHPHTGERCVWVNEMQTVRLDGMEWEESRDLLHTIYDCLYDSANVFEHRWRNGDLIIWDNIALQHARSNLDKVGKRLLQRAIVGTEGTVPFIPD